MVFKMELVQTTLVPLELKEEQKSNVIKVDINNTKKEFTYQLYKNSNMVMTNTSALTENVSNCVWVESEQEGLYGVQKIVAINNGTALTALPTLKDLEKLEIGKYYRIMYKGLKDLGGYHKKVIEVEEIDYKTYVILSLNYNERDMDVMG